MSFEETLVCDGCSTVIDGGPREQTLASLRDVGGRAFMRPTTATGRRLSEWRELPADQPWGISRRHLCGNCAEKTVFYDGEPVPPRQETVA